MKKMKKIILYPNSGTLWASIALFMLIGYKPNDANASTPGGAVYSCWLMATSPNNPDGPYVDYVTNVNGLLIYDDGVVLYDSWKSITPLVIVCNEAPHSGRLQRPS